MTTSMEWKDFEDSKSMGYNFFIYGNYGRYDGSGYYQHFTPYNTTLREFQANITQMKKDKYLSDLSTVAICVTLTLYNPKFDYYISVLFVSIFLLIS